MKGPEKPSFLGYKGDYIVMQNGVDIPKGRVSQGGYTKAAKRADLPEGVPVYLFVGRMMWYKGLKIVFDGLRRLKEDHKPFRLVLIGKGKDKEEMEKYTEEAGIRDQCVFTGAIYDRMFFVPGTAGQICFCFLPAMIQMALWFVRRQPADWQAHL